MKYLILILATLYLTGCHTRQIKELSSAIPENSDAITSSSNDSLPKTWRGKKLFDSPYAYFYANTITDVNEAYDIIRKTNNSYRDDNDQNLQKGVVIVTGVEQAPVLKLDELISLYKAALDSGVLTKQEKVKYHKDHKSLLKKQTAIREMKQKHQGLKSFEHMMPLFIQALILSKLLSNNPDNKEFLAENDIWWGCFMSLEDVSDTYIDNTVDTIYSAATKDSGSVAKGLTWTLSAPIIYPLKTYAKFKIGSTLKNAFIKKLKKNAAPHEGIVTVNAEVILE